MRKLLVIGLLLGAAGALAAPGDLVLLEGLTPRALTTGQATAINAIAGTMVSDLQLVQSLTLTRDEATGVWTLSGTTYRTATATDEALGAHIRGRVQADGKVKPFGRGQ